MSKSGGVFQFSGGRTTSRGQCSRGVCACERLHAPPPLRKSCRPIRACNMPSRSVEIKQPPQHRPKLAIHCRVPLSLYCRVSPPPQPPVSPCPRPGPAVSTAGSRYHCTAGPRRLYCWVPPSLLLVCSRLTPGLSP